MDNNVNHPEYYGGKDNPYEVIKVIEAFGFGFHLGNALKYIARAGKKNPEKEIEDLEKAQFYLNQWIRLKKQNITHDENSTEIKAYSCLEEIREEVKSKFPKISEKQRRAEIAKIIEETNARCETPEIKLNLTKKGKAGLDWGTGDIQGADKPVVSE
jgi:hypothetical protein